MKNCGEGFSTNFLTGAIVFQKIKKKLKNTKL